VESHQVDIAILTIELEPEGNQASVRLARNDVVGANGNSHKSSVEQALILSKESGRWVIVEIGD
jgi:hypothetical protein